VITFDSRREYLDHIQVLLGPGGTRQLAVRVMDYLDKNEGGSIQDHIPECGEDFTAHLENLKPWQIVGCLE